MENTRFDAYVPISLGRSGESYHIDNVRQAADILLHRWPVDGGHKHATAMKACMMVIDGVKHAKHARMAFAAAAKEAGILLD